MSGSSDDGAPQPRLDDDAATVHDLLLASMTEAVRVCGPVELAVVAAEAAPIARRCKPSRRR